MKNRTLTQFFLMIIIVINVSGVLAQSIFYTGINCGKELDQYGYAYKNGKHYLVWSNGSGRYYWGALYSNYDNYVKLSSSTDGINWTTENIISTTYGSYNLKIAIDNNNKIHIAYTQPTQIDYLPYGSNAADVVYLTDKSGSWDKQTVVGTYGYYQFYASDLITIGPDEKISVFYHSDHWWGYGSPLLVKKFNGTNWENEITVANYGILNNCDDRSNILKGYDIENNQLVLYVSNGHYYNT